MLLQIYYLQVVFGIKIPEVYNQDQKNNNENSQTITELMEQ
jgi:hypothetical protein